MNSEKKSLVWNALPSIFDVPNPPPTVTPTRKPPKRRKVTVEQDTNSKNVKEARTVSKGPLSQVPVSEISPTKSSSAPIPETPTKGNLKKQIKRLNSKIWRRDRAIKNTPKNKNNTKQHIDAIVNELDEYLPTNTVKFIKTQVKMSKRTKKGYRWPAQEKTLALSIYYHSKKAYKILGKIFKLPSKSTLHRVLQRTNVIPGFSEKVFDALKLKAATMTEDDKICTLIFDEMSLKTGLSYTKGSDTVEGFEDFGDLGKTKYIANHALAFVIRGVKQKWKQPLGYFLSSGPISVAMLRSLVRNCIEKVFSIGFNVKILICDQGSNNRSFLEQKEGVSVKNPFFMVGEKRIFVMYDPPHLVKIFETILKNMALKVENHI